MADQIQYVKDKKDYEKYMENTLFVSYFTASWCGPCQAIKPKMEEYYTQFPNVEIAKIDIDNCQDIAKDESITSVPTLKFHHNKKEVSVVRGANLEQIQKQLTSLSKLAPAAERHGNHNGGSSNANWSQILETSKYVSSVHSILNGNINFAECETLNISGNKDPRCVFKADKEGPVHTDADSQGLFVVVFNSSVKIFSILLKLAEGQSPNKIKLWRNVVNGISFDDVESIEPEQEIEIKDSGKGDGWVELRLSYVKFQNVGQLSLFIDGEDEDESTVVEKIVFVGVE